MKKQLFLLSVGALCCISVLNVTMHTQSVSASTTEANKTSLTTKAQNDDTKYAWGKSAHISLNADGLLTIYGGNPFNDDGTFTLIVDVLKNNSLNPDDVKIINIDGTLDMSEGLKNNSGNGLFFYLNNITQVKNFKNIKNLNSYHQMFSSLPLFDSIDFTGVDSSTIVSMKQMFDAASLKSLDLSGLDTSNVTSMEKTFRKNVGLKSLNMNGLDTSKVTTFNSLVSEDHALTDFDVSKLDTSSAEDMSYMFCLTDNLRTLDLSNFDMTNVTAKTEMFRDSGVRSLKLSDKFKMGADVKLPEPTKDATYTGKWQNVGTGTVDNPKGNNVWTSAEFMANFNNSSDKNDTYVWQKNAGADIIVNYHDEDGKEIHAAQIISGPLDSAYDATTTQYQIEIPGYVLDQDKLPANTKGTVTDAAQTVNYVYKKKAVDATVKYVDENGKSIHANQVISGAVGDLFDTLTPKYQLAISGYTLDKAKLPSNAKGQLSDKAQTIVYKYKKNVAPTNYVKIFRVYNKNTGEHLYTTSGFERDSLVKAGWSNEGTGWSAPDKGTAVYRVYNPNAKGGDHYYTSSKFEAESLIKSGWKWDNNGKAIFYSGGKTPVYVAYNPNAQSGSHNYTQSSYEQKSLLNNGWKFGSTAFYGK